MSTYASIEQLTERYSERELRHITDSAGQSLDVAVAQRALQDASEEIDSYIARRYTLPLATPVPVLVRCCCDVAIYRLQTLRPADDIKDARQRYEDVLKLLKLVASGESVLAGQTTRADVALGSGMAVGVAVMEQPPSVFGRGNR